MAMVVKNNMAAVRTLNTLNSNSSALQKSLAKVSSGMKINSAQDDASGYAISERMRVQIRALDQANQNTQNGSSLMKTAEGAVASTIEILKTMKEKAINAATDTNTDDDRATIQKEINQFVDQIDDNALVTFNGKYLVEGSKVQSGEATYTALTNQSLAKGTTGDTALTALQNRKDEALGILSTDRITASYVKDGRTYATTFTASDTTLKGIFQKLEDIDTTSQIFADSSNKSVQAADPSLATAETTSTGTTSGGYDKDSLSTAKADLEAQLEAAKAAQAAAVGDLGSIGQGSVKLSATATLADGSTGLGYVFNSDISVTGAAGDLAKLLVEAANAGDLASANAVNMTANLTPSDGGAGAGARGAAVSLYDPDSTHNKGVGVDTAANSTVLISAGAGTAIGNDAAPVINLAGFATTNNAALTAAAKQSWTTWDGVDYGTNTVNTATSDTLKQAIANVVGRLKADSSGIAGDSDAAVALADKIEAAYKNYANAVTAADAANKEVNDIQAKLDLVNTAITAIEAKEDVDEAKAGMAAVIEAHLTQLSHAGGDGANDGTAKLSVLANNQYVEYKLLNGNATASGLASNLDGGHTTSKYYSDESAISEISSELADKIATNIEYYVSGSTDTVTAESAMRSILSTVGAANTTAYLDSAYNTVSGDIKAGKWAASDYVNAYGSDSAGTPYLQTTNELYWGNTADTTIKPDINGFAAAYDKYAQAAYTVKQKQDDLDSVMKDYAGATSAGPALLSGNAIGLNTSGEIVRTADETDGITITAQGEGLAGQIAGVTISVADAVGNAKKSVNASLNAFKTTIFAANESKEDTSLKLHVGGAANQSLSVGMMDMRSQALGLKGSDGSVISVTTQDNANAAIAAFDNALAKALDQATTIGAIEARLEYTSSNLTTSSENVQAAESTIRDADMAKEMTTYTKNNVLLQAAQSMLAQANQNASAVLSLLQ